MVPGSAAVYNRYNGHKAHLAIETGLLAKVKLNPDWIKCSPALVSIVVFHSLLWFWAGTIVIWWYNSVQGCSFQNSLLIQKQSPPSKGICQNYIGNSFDNVTLPLTASWQQDGKNKSQDTFNKHKFDFSLSVCMNLFLFSVCSLFGKMKIIWESLKKLGEECYF